MKIGGLDPKTLSREHVLVLPRGDDEQVVFKAVGIRDLSEFDKLCPEPKPPKVVTKNGAEYRESDPAYLEILGHYNRKRFAYLVVHSLAPSQIEWDTVEMNNPKTWTNWQEDLQNSGFNQWELGRITNLVLEANSLDESKLEAARKSFLAGQQKADASTSGLQIAPGTTPSGEPVSA
jgi:hypothetical protein